MTEFAASQRLHLDGDALVSNWRYLQAQGTAACGAAVKADGYGLGAREVVRRLRDAGCRDFFVAHWHEAGEIADLVDPKWVSVLNGITAEDLPLARELGATPVLNTPKQVSVWKAAGGGTCHLMLDTGINRLGIGKEQCERDLFDGLQIDILMSHLASGDEDSEQNRQQLALFGEQASFVKAQRRSLANSAGILLGSDYHFDLVRPGLALYGGHPRKNATDAIAPVVKLSARILQVRQLQVGDSVGYNATYSCVAPTRVATLSIGYADGYWRGFSGKGSVIVNDVRLPVLGRISMDLTTVDISALPDAQEGDWAEISFELAEAAQLSGFSQYELLTGLGKRFERIWK
jgi:alanine racemase